MCLFIQNLVGWLFFVKRPGQQLFSHVGTEPPLSGYLPVLWSGGGGGGGFTETRHCTIWEAYNKCASQSV